ncbi:hypothetical protein KY336_01040 [Candidatus Woesearchaeota archaeon]|nr:hypothetical protein [Candidatus Woesearchaeota archaeon]
MARELPDWDDEEFIHNGEGFYETIDYSDDNKSDSELEEELERIEKEAKFRSRREFLKLMGFGAAGLGILGSGIMAFDWGCGTGKLRRAILTGLGIREWKYECENPTNFKLPFSPLEEYARIEKDILKELGRNDGHSIACVDHAVKVADFIADNIAKRVLETVDTYDAAEAVSKFKRTDYIKMIADEMANAGLFYSEEGLLSRAFDPDLHQEGYFHADCDLIAFIMMHIGRRHNVGMHPLLGPYHLYLTVDSDKEDRCYIVEPTEFRKIEENGSYVNYAGRGIGEGFFSDYDRQKFHGGIVASKEMEEAALLHVPIEDPKILKDGITANILQSLYADAKREDNLDERIAIFNILERTVRDGTRNYVLANNYVITALDVAEDCLKHGRVDDASNLLTHAEYGFNEYKPMINQKGLLERNIREFKQKLAFGRAG